MSDPRTTLFLERRSYRRRRFMDVVRVLPIAAVFFFMLPMLWALGDENAAQTTNGGIYLFLIWLAFIVLSAVAARVLGTPVEERERDDP